MMTMCRCFGAGIVSIAAFVAAALVLVLVLADACTRAS
jgi:hypothetical protein